MMSFWFYEVLFFFWDHIKMRQNRHLYTTEVFWGERYQFWNHFPTSCISFQFSITNSVMRQFWERRKEAFLKYFDPDFLKFLINQCLSISFVRFTPGKSLKGSTFWRIENRKDMFKCSIVFVSCGSNVIFKKIGKIYQK